MLPLKDDQPRYSTPVVNYFLIAINILIFAFQSTLSPREGELFARQFGLVPNHLALYLAGSPKYTLAQVVIPFFTSMFLHGGWMHVLGNMWFLYIFGDNVEDYLGHFKYLIFYLLAGLFAMTTQVAIYPRSTLPTLGASGAIAGVLGAYLILYPRARVLTWFFVFVMYLPAWIVLGEWFLLNFFSGTQTLSMARAGHDVGGVAFWAHIGGFISGMLMIKLFPERARRYPYAYR
ncbi:MAG TPA: rhomboid family intramembrane serine protease [Candidatus Sulfotelmatobacter sp.]|jgi:membrane associated rhomboid family serine protease|nr:rhomboid family intramembrane serine protease [Candidatus Sulfotelmatobacter sp.]